MPDATGLELVAQRVREGVADDAVTGTHYAPHGEATLEVAPAPCATSSATSATATRSPTSG